MKYLICLLLICIISCQKLPVEVSQSPNLSKRGITLVDWTANGYSQSAAERAINAIAASGATHLLIMVTGYQATQTSNVVRLDPARSSTPSSVKQAISWGTSLGLKVVLKPHILSDDRSLSMEIKPSEPEAWFASYQQFLLPWAVLAESTGGEQFIIGTELGSTVQHKELWRQTIRKVRLVFKGELVYAASWDEAHFISFWQELDYVGVDFYFPVTNRKDPSRFDILAGWQPWLQRLELLSKQTGRKIILTEIGYRSVDGAGMNPYKFDSHGPVDLSEQADLYWAALQATAEIPWIAGIYWWNWSADGSGGPNNSDYTPFGKPAELELQQAWTGN